MGPAAILEARGITKRFGFLPVLRGVDLHLRRGELLLLLGPNGAGKTTLTRILATLARPSGGSLLLDGRPLPPSEAGILRSLTGYLSHQTFLYGHLTARENLLFFGALYGVEDLPARVEEQLRRVGLSHARGRKVGAFSRGMQQRLSLARVLLTDPAILILDEPYTGLDPEGTEALTSVLGALKESHRALLLVTHDVEACLPVADRMAVLCRGQIVLEAPVGGAAGLAEVRSAYLRAVDLSRAGAAEAGAGVPGEAS